MFPVREGKSRCYIFFHVENDLTCHHYADVHISGRTCLLVYICIVASEWQDASSAVPVKPESPAWGFWAGAAESPVPRLPSLSGGCRINHPRLPQSLWRMRNESPSATPVTLADSDVNHPQFRAQLSTGPLARLVMISLRSVYVTSQG